MPRVLLSGVLGTEPRTADAVLRKLRDGGHEVVVVAAGVSAEELAAIAIQEDVVAIALATGDEDVLTGDLPSALATYDAGDIVVFATG